jgi:cell wall assembly regulator SMI1
MNLWDSFKKVVDEKYPVLSGVLADEVPMKELKAFESDLGVELPSLFFDILGSSNGQKDETKFYFFGTQLMSLEEIKNEMEMNDELVESMAGEGDMCSSTPENHIKCEYASNKWIPLFNSGGTCIGIDLDPGELGTQGQIINFGADDEDKYVLAKSLDEFIKFSKDKLVAGKDITFNEQYEFYGYTELCYSDAIAREAYFENS